MTKQRVLVTAHFLRAGDRVDQRLREAGFETVFNRYHAGRTEEELISMLQGIDGALASIEPLTARVFSAVDRLKVISRSGVGYDTVDVAAATSRGIPVCIPTGVNRRAVAEFTMALLLQCARKVVQNGSDIPRGRWVKHSGRDLAGSTLGIVGLGAIGKEVARRARGFEMRILAYARRPDEAFGREHGITYVPLEQLLRESDFISLHLPLNDGTRYLLNAERLALMKPTAYLVNTARGGIVDTQALCEALKERRIAGAALDVFEREPLGESPLLELDNVYLSSHVAADTPETLQAAGMLAAENLIAVLRGDYPMHNILNPEALNGRRPPAGS